MDKNTLISHFAESEEEKIKFAHLFDTSKRRDERGIITYTSFFSEGEQMRGEKLLSHMGVCDFFFFGGFDDAERKVAVFLPEYFLPDDVKNEPSLAGIAIVRAEVPSFYKDADITHRDVLGSLMGLGVERETVGDILVDKGCIEFATTEKVCPFILDSLEKISRYPVKVERINDFTLKRKDDFEICFDTVSSMRLDAVVASLFSMSRSQSSDAILSGLVSLDGVITKKCDSEVREGSHLTLRGRGRARVEKIDGVSKKGRVRIIFKK